MVCLWKWEINAHCQIQHFSFQINLNHNRALGTLYPAVIDVYNVSTGSRSFIRGLITGIKEGSSNLATLHTKGRLEHAATPTLTFLWWSDEITVYSDNLHISLSLSLSFPHRQNPLISDTYGSDCFEKSWKIYSTDRIVAVNPWRWPSWTRKVLLVNSWCKLTYQKFCTSCRESGKQQNVVSTEVSFEARIQTFHKSILIYNARKKTNSSCCYSNITTKRMLLWVPASSGLLLPPPS